MTGAAPTGDDLGVKIGAWNALVRRARIGRERKEVALVVSSYADASGRKIHCGVARLAVDCEIGYSTARRYLKWLRDVGLIELVRAGSQRKGLSDEYRLIIGPDVLEHIEVPTPAEYDAMRDELRDTNRASQKARRTRDQRSSKASADPEGPETDLRSPRASAENGDQRSLEARSALTQGEPPPSLYTSPGLFTSPKNSGDLCTDVAVVGEPAGEDQNFSPEIEPTPTAAADAPAEPDSPSNVVPIRRGVAALIQDDEPPTRQRPEKGYGTCIECYVAGQYVAAADPLGDFCATHLRAARSPA